MSFVVGNYYKCIKSGGGFSSGNFYKCTDASPNLGAQIFMTLVEFEDCSGTRYLVAPSSFDPTPRRGSGGLGHRYHAGFTRANSSHEAGQGVSPPAAANNSPIRWSDQAASFSKKSDVCDCGKQAEKKTFNTFEYLYCSACKKEVVARPQLRRRRPPSPLSQPRIF